MGDMTDDQLAADARVEASYLTRDEAATMALAVALNTAQIKPAEMALGHDLRVPAQRILATLRADPAAARAVATALLTEEMLAEAIAQHYVDPAAQRHEAARILRALRGKP